MTITIEIPDKVYAALDAARRKMTKPPTEREDGATIIEPVFPSVEAMISEILSVNIRSYIGQELVDEETKQINEQIAALQRRLVEKTKPVVRRAQ